VIKYEFPIDDKHKRKSIYDDGI